MIGAQLAPLALFSPIQTNKNIETAILLKKKSKGQITKTDVSTQPPRVWGQALLVMPWGIYGSYVWDTRINFREGSFE